MPLTTGDVKKIAYLARLGIDEVDIDSYTKELTGLLELVDQLSKVDTREIIPMAHPMDQVQRLRNDEVTEKDNRTLFQSQAPQVEAGLYLVPKVID